MELTNKYYCIADFYNLTFSDLQPNVELDFHNFKKLWNNLSQDNYMADGGKYRYRRYSVIICLDNFELVFLPPEPHFQKIIYNNLNGDVYRYYEPFEESGLRSNFLKSAIITSCKIFNQIRGKKLNWRVECHQFRITPLPNEQGFPTPEGKHRDGREFVLIMLIDRKNIRGGVTRIYNNDNLLIKKLTMKRSQECIFLDDNNVLHEVSPIRYLKKGQIGYRDVIVLTFQQQK